MCAYVCAYYATLWSSFVVTIENHYVHAARQCPKPRIRLLLLLLLFTCAKNAVTTIFKILFSTYSLCGDVCSIAGCVLIYLSSVALYCAFLQRLYANFPLRHKIVFLHAILHMRARVCAHITFYNTRDTALNFYFCQHSLTNFRFKCRRTSIQCRNFKLSPKSSP